MKILVTGGNGTMGRALRKFLPGAIYLGRDELDVTDGDACVDAWIDYRPDIVIHAAAETDHQCPDVERVVRANILGSQNIAAACNEMDVRFVYLSTHYVYPGTTGNYRETDAVGPIGTYALTKYAGELLTREYYRNWLCIRGSWYTPAKRDAWFKNGALTDAYCSRETPYEAAEKIARLALSDVTGVINIGGPRRSFADILVEEGYEAEDLPRITRGQLRLPYDFPADSSVNTDKYNALFT